MAKITLKAARVNAGLRQKEVAEILGVSNKTLSSWESGETFPRADQVAKLCSLYRLTYNDINFLPEDTL